ncbi:LacI family DNA-binding transcriptional regulator [Acidobacterium sp. S8]|uniref:LacI family DNA-binding transcriptional regulator n=1 Tax=Acidobacterium sp. S8 TaxID=1641854 RepID=UPI00131DF8E8|nr:LacI family DNA-binding transcriptional regulator [Acidobacterium sp. S8]
MSHDPKDKQEAPHSGDPINLKQLASILQLSQTTVSLVLNNSPAAKSIPAHTRERVFQAARKFHYRPNYFARSLRRNRSMSIGVIAPDLSEGYFTMVMNGVEEFLIRAQYFYFTASHYWNMELMQEYPRLLVERAVDGFLLLNTPSEIRSPLPTVAVSAHNNSPGVTNVVLDHLKGAELALRHLYELGHRKMAFVKGPNIIPDTEYRWRSILEVARELGIEMQTDHCIQLDADSWSPEVGYGPMRDLLARTRDFTAIFCFNDISAIGVIRAIYDAGLTVPGDISVVGFDDIMSAAYHQPSLTTVRQPLREMGRQGAQVLLEMIAQPSNQFPEEIVMQPELIVRESTGPVSTRRPKRKS